MTPNERRYQAAIIRRLARNHFGRRSWIAKGRKRRQAILDAWTKALEAVPWKDLEDVLMKRPSPFRIIVTEGIVTVSKKDSMTELRREVGRANAAGLMIHGYDEEIIFVESTLAALQKHAVFAGISGMGKTQAMGNCLVQALTLNGPAIIVDPHHTLVDYVLQAMPEHRVKDLRIIRPAANIAGAGINILQAPAALLRQLHPTLSDSQIRFTAANLFVEAMGAATQDLTTYASGTSFQSLVRMAALLALESADATALDLYRIITNSEFRMQALVNCSSSEVKEYFLNTFVDLDASYLERARAKLEWFLDERLQRAFCDNARTSQLHELIDGSAVFVFDLHATTMDPQAVQLCGSLLLQLSMFLAKQRTSNSRPLTIMLDEAASYTSNSVIAFMVEARKFQTSLCLGAQYLGQFAPEIRSSLGNAGLFVAFRTTPEDSVVTAPLFDQHADAEGVARELRHLPTFYAMLRHDETGQNLPGQMARWPSTVLIRSLPPLTPLRRTTDVLAKHDASLQPYRAPSMDANLAVRALFATQLSKSASKLPFVQLDDVEGTLARWSLETKGLRARLDMLTQQGKVASSPAGFKLTTAGIRNLSNAIVPALASQEGSREHRALVWAIFVALSKLSVQASTPVQGTQKATPDLHAMLPPNVAERLGNNAAWIQAEVSGTKHPARVVKSIAVALENGAAAIVVPPAETTASDALATATRLGDQLRKALSSVSVRSKHTKTAVGTGPGAGWEIWVLFGPGIPTVAYLDSDGNLRRLADDDVVLQAPNQTAAPTLLSDDVQVVVAERSTTPPPKAAAQPPDDPALRSNFNSALRRLARGRRDGRFPVPEILSLMAERNSALASATQDQMDRWAAAYGLKRTGDGAHAFYG